MRSIIATVLSFLLSLLALLRWFRHKRYPNIGSFPIASKMDVRCGLGITSTKM